MFKFHKTTKKNGFGSVSNSYSWSAAELNGYIYIGTCTDFISNSIKNFGNLKLKIPAEISKNPLFSFPEIWRYKADGTSKWEKVFQPLNKKIFGFRAMINHKNALYAAATGSEIAVYKSTNGTDWIKINTDNVEGITSRSLASLNGKLYIGTLKSGIAGTIPYLYSSEDPETHPFELVIDQTSAGFEPLLNPMGAIDNLIVFNDRLYVGISTPEGAEIWRSDTNNPKNNEWTMIADRGFGDSLNYSIMASGIFNDKLYISVTKLLPLSLFLPLGFDLIEIDKNDSWKVIVGGKPVIPSSSAFKRNNPVSGMKSGFNSFFNVYGWQITEFKKHLFITTYNDSSNIFLYLDFLKYNKKDLCQQIGRTSFKKLVNFYETLLHLMKKYNYPKGFDIYISKNGNSFYPLILNGLHNKNNYGGRSLVASGKEKLFVGTANPFQGTEVWEIFSCRNSDFPCSNIEINDYNMRLNAMNKEISKLYPSILPIIYKLVEANDKTKK